MGTPPAVQGAGESLDSQLAAIQSNLPGLVSSINQQNPIAQNAALTQANDVTSAGGLGSTLMSNENTLNRAANPDYYNSLDATASKYDDLLNSYSLTGLTPGESAAAERGANITNTNNGNMNVGSPLTTVQNAMSFGSAFDAKRAALNSVLNTGNSFLNTAAPTNTAAATVFGSPAGQSSASSLISGLSSAASSAANTFNAARSAATIPGGTEGGLTSGLSSL